MGKYRAMRKIKQATLFFLSCYLYLSKNNSREEQDILSLKAYFIKIKNSNWWLLN